MTNHLQRENALQRPSARAVAGLAVAVTLACAALSPAASAAGTRTESAPVVVTSPLGLSETVQAVRAVGGVVLSTLPLIGGVEAVLPAGAALPEGVVVAENRPVSVATSHGPADLPVSTVRETIGLPADGSEGAGVTVAVVDTGVADVPDLQGQVVAHVDVTGSGGGDGFGHGTFMAGLIAGTGAESGGVYRGAAPGARILDVKVARQDGSTDLISVLRGLQVVADEGKRYGVKVVNLSLASNSPMPYQVDPLNEALRNLWRRGVTVVVAGGNSGPAAGSVASPGNDPMLLTVGALNDQGTAARGDDVVPGFSGRGPTSQGVSKPDIAAPGASVVSLRSPGSVVDTAYPSARVAEDYFRGSGTSMSAAVTSGAVAALLAESPKLRPDQVKGLLTQTAYDGEGLSEVLAAGHGGLDVRAAIERARDGKVQPWKNQEAAIPGDPKTWANLNEAFDANDQKAAEKAWAALSPEAKAWAARSWATADDASREWVGRSWLGRSWLSADGTTDEWLMRYWAGRSWLGRSWLGNEWAGRSWLGRSWLGEDWQGRSWLGRSWLGDDWQGRSWLGRSWLGRSWLGDDWTSSAWADSSWSGGVWSGDWR